MFRARMPPRSAQAPARPAVQAPVRPPASHGRDPEAAPSLAGMRLVRSLGEGPRAEVLLCHDAVAGPVAVKLERAPGCGDVAEALALARVDHPHVVGLRDVLTDGDGRLGMVLERLGPGSLASLLAERGELRPGEAVTLLAPVAEAVDAMHLSGTAHGGLRPGAVLLRPNGAPVLACFGRATLHSATTAADRAAHPAIAADRSALGNLVRAVLDHVPGEEFGALRRSLDEFTTTDAPGRRIADALFEAAEPEPLALGGRAAPPLTGRAVPAAPVAPVAATRPFSARIRDGVSAALRSLGTVRRRAWLGAGAVVALGVATTVLLELSSGGEGELSGSAASSASVPSPSPVEGTGPPGRTLNTSQVELAPELRGDDPVAATARLLAQRGSCLEALSLECLVGIVQAGSPAERLDLERITSVLGGGELDNDPFRGSQSLTLVERLGDSAIVALGGPGGDAEAHPASVLVMKTEAGWRIRDYVVE